MLVGLEQTVHCLISHVQNKALWRRISRLRHCCFRNLAVSKCVICYCEHLSDIHFPSKSCTKLEIAYSYLLANI